MGRKG